MYIHVLMRDETEGRKKQARSNKQQLRQSNTQGNHFSKKNELPRVHVQYIHYRSVGWVESYSTRYTAQLAGLNPTYILLRKNNSACHTGCTKTHPTHAE